MVSQVVIAIYSEGCFHIRSDEQGIGYLLSLATRLDLRLAWALI